VAQAAVKETGRIISEQGLPDHLVPFICGFAGYGHVSQGAQEIYDLLPVEEIEAAKLTDFMERNKFSNRMVYKVVFREEHLVRRKDGENFELQEYYDYPEKYNSIFNDYIPHLTLLINGIYWEPRYPRLVTKSYLKHMFKQDQTARLRVIGDITCDVDGSIESNVTATDSLNPIYVYDPLSKKVTDGYEGRGVVMMAVDKLPSELPREASDMFGDALFPYLAGLAGTDFKQPFEDLEISEEFRSSVIAHQGRLTPDYQHLKEFIR
jgi:alpha-aminoadipic semialdehyde synthase